MNAVLQCLDLSKRFGAHYGARNVSFDMAPGQVMCVLGPSGCGKTTLLRLIAGLEVPDEGEIKLDGNIVSSRVKHVPPEKRNTGMVFQDYSLFPHMNVEQNIKFGLQNYSVDDRQRRFKEVLELVRLSDFSKSYPHELSGGQQQRVALARTLAPSPSVVLLDEPFSNLDAVTRREMLSEIKKIIKDGHVASILVTHDREEAFSVADTLAVMFDGRIVQIDSPDEVYSSPATIEVGQLVVDCEFLDGRIVNGAVNTSIGSFPFTSYGKELMSDQPVKVLVRHDEFRMAYDPNGLFKVISKEFRGTKTVYEVQANQFDISLKCQDSEGTDFGIGMTVNLIKATMKPFVVFEA